MATQNRIEWDATDARDGGAERIVWETLLVMERFNYHAGERDQGAVARVLDLAKAFEWVSLPVVWPWATHFSFPGKVLRVLCGYFEHQRRVQFEGCAAEPLQAITAILPWFKWSCSLLRIVLQYALSEVTKYPHLKLMVFVDGITAFMNGEEQGVGGDGREGSAEVEKRGG